MKNNFTRDNVMGGIGGEAAERSLANIYLKQ